MACGPQPLTTRGKPTKFTPERLQQIINLVERGKSRDEIADTLGVTVGSLQVTCSRLGISLRRPRIDNGVRFLRKRTPQNTSHSQGNAQSEPAESGLIAKPQQELANIPKAWSASLAIMFRYRGMERTDELPLTPHTMGKLALEAALRDVEIGELIAELITAIVNKDRFPPVFDNIDPATDRIAADELSKRSLAPPRPPSRP